MKLALLILLAACGNDSRRSEERAEPRAVETPPASCKTGDNVCVGDDVVVCEKGRPGHKLSTCRGGCKQGACIDTCGANDVELIYVVDSNRTLLSFDPRKLPDDPFKQIGKLTCDPASSPFSMAVDRTGIAWVLYQTGRLYQVSILNAHCLARSTRAHGGPRTFGMGFVTDGPKSTTEQLFVAAENTSHELATLDLSTPEARWRPAGTITAGQTRNPELSGTSEGKLYGYFPGDPGRGFVQELDRTGKPVGKRWPLPGETGHVSAWAFAFWGDAFYVFMTLDGTNEVHAISRKTGTHQLVRDSIPYRIVGAGVSTCAPLLEKPL